MDTSLWHLKGKWLSGFAIYEGWRNQWIQRSMSVAAFDFLLEKDFPCQNKEVNKFMTKSIYYMCGRYLYVIMHCNSILHETRNKYAILKIWQFRVFEQRNYEYLLSKKFPYSELFWSAFFSHFPASISPYSVQMRENAGKMRTRITPDTDTFYTVLNLR